MSYIYSGDGLIEQATEDVLEWQVIGMSNRLLMLSPCENLFFQQILNSDFLNIMNFRIEFSHKILLTQISKTFTHLQL